MELRKYLQNGQEVVVISHIERGYLVKNILLDEDGEELIDEFIYLVDKVYDSPPIEKYNDDIVIRQFQIGKLNDEIKALERKRNDLQNSIGKMKQRKMHINFS